MKTSLKPLQVQYLFNDTVTAAMSGNAGIAAVRLQKAYPEMTLEERGELAVKLRNIELEARQQMAEVITTLTK